SMVIAISSASLRRALSIRCASQSGRCGPLAMRTLCWLPGSGVSECAPLMRAPLWLILLMVLAIVGIGVYGYFTTPLPLGLSSVIRTPGGSNVAAPAGTAVSAPAGARTAAGQPLVLGSTNVVVQTVTRNQDLSAGGRGPAGVFT